MSVYEQKHAPAVKNHKQFSQSSSDHKSSSHQWKVSALHRNAPKIPY